MSIFRKLTYPKEVKQLLSVLDYEAESFEKYDFKEVKQKTILLIVGNVDGTANFIKRNRPDLKALVLRLIVMAADSMITTGQYHVYRGVLSMYGQDIYKICLKAINGLVECGNISREQADEDIKTLNKDISEVG